MIHRLVSMVVAVVAIVAGMLGPLAGAAFADTNRTSIAIPLIGTRGSASPYPTTINVEARGGPLQVAQIAVNLHGLTHPCPGDLSILLVHNNVDKYLLMSRAGGCRPMQGTSLDIRAGLLAMPQNPPASPAFGESETVGPSIYGGVPILPGVPAGPVVSGLPPATTNVNGAWSLYIFDHGDISPAARGVLAAGWSITYDTDVIDLSSPAGTAIPSAGTFGPSNFYPATFSFSTVPADVVVQRVDLQLSLSHGFPDDIRMVLQSPAGTTVQLMANAGGNVATVGAQTIHFMTGVNTPIPDAGPLVSGNFAPSIFGAAVGLPAPAPQPPYETSLAVFTGQPVRGQWRLWVYDDKVGDTGNIGSAELTINIRWPRGGSLESPATGTSTFNQPFVPVEFDIYGHLVTDSAAYRVANAGVFYDAGVFNARPSPNPSPIPGVPMTRFYGEVPLRKGSNNVRVLFYDTEGLSVIGIITVNVDEFTYSLAEGATGTFFDLDVSLANPSSAPAPISIEFLPEGEPAIPFASSVAANASLPLQIDSLVPDKLLSTIVHSTDAVPLAVERTMIWDERGYGGHGGNAVAPATRWLFAEGAQGYFSTFVLLANDGNAAANVTVNFLLETGGTVAHAVTVQPKRRVTVYAGDIPALVNQSFGIDVQSSAPIIAERAMYLPGPRTFEGGHGSAGVNSPSTNWFLAEGATGPFFECFVLMSNPNSTNANVTLTYLLPDGTTVTQLLVVPANGRRTVNVETVDAQLLNTPVSTTVVSDVGVVVERAMYWPDISAGWQEAHNSFGVTETALRWGLADGRIGGPRNYETYVLLANPNPREAEVRVRFLKAGNVVTRNYTLNPTSRLNIWVSQDVPELGAGTFGVEVQVLNFQPIAVEKAMYWNSEGITWAGGTNVTATRLPPP